MCGVVRSCYRQRVQWIRLVVLHTSLLNIPWPCCRSSGSKCAVCMEAQAELACIPCGHLCLCDKNNCAAQLFAKDRTASKVCCRQCVLVVMNNYSLMCALLSPLFEFAVSHLPDCARPREADDKGLQCVNTVASCCCCCYWYTAPEDSGNPETQIFFLP